MLKLRTCLWLFVATVPVVPLGAQPNTAKDHSPPAAAAALPLGARLRLGSSALATGEAAVGGALSADGRYLAVAGRDGLTLFDRKFGKKLAAIAVNGMAGGFPRALAFDPDGKFLVHAGVRGVGIVAVPSGTPIRHLTTDDQTFAGSQGLSVSANGRVVAVGMNRTGGNKKVKAFAWNVADGKALGPFEVLQNAGCCTALSPDGKTLATWGRHFARMVGEDQTASQVVQLWDVASGKELRQLKSDRPNAEVRAAAFAPDGKSLAVASGTSTFHLFDPISGKELRRFAGRRSTVTILEFSPDGVALVAGSFDGTLQAWHIKSGKRFELHTGPKARLAAVAFPGEGQIIALGLIGQDVTWWNAVTGEAAAAGPGHRAPVLAVAFAPDGRSLTSVSADNAALRWDAATGKLLGSRRLVDAETARVMGSGIGARRNGVALSPDGRFAATDGADAGNSVRLWDLKTGQAVCDFELAMRGSGSGLAFSARGDRLAAMNATKTVKIWDAESGQEVANLPFNIPGNAAVPPAGVFSPDGAALAIIVSFFDPTNGLPGSKIIVLDARTGKDRFTLQGGSDPEAVRFGTRTQAGAAIAFSPDGKLLALPGPGQTIVVVRADRGKEWRRLSAPGLAFISALAFSPDSRTLAVAHGGQRLNGPMGTAAIAPTAVGVWELASGQRRVEYQGQQGGVNALAFAPDGQTLASGAADTTVMLWDLGGRPGEKAVALDADWAVLGKDDAAAAFTAQRRLIAAPAETVAFVKAHLAPARAAPVDAKQLAQWVAGLDSEDFTTRDTAYHALEKLGAPAEPALRKARTANASLEMRRRIDDLLDKLERGHLTPEELRAARAIEVLERIGTADARALVTALAEGDATAVLTREARTTLGRMRK